jgi:hypothetical protein
VRRFRLAALVFAAAPAVAACGSVRTELPTNVTPPPPLDTVAGEPATLATVDPAASQAVAEPAAPPTTASAFKTPGEKHPLPGGSLAPSYPRVGVKPPKGVAPVPAGQAWAVVNVRFCADAATPIDGALVDPARFRVEVPGQGEVTPSADAPALAKTPLKAGTAGTPGVSPGTCVEGYLAYLVAGEGHIESITYDTGAGLLRWAT